MPTTAAALAQTGTSQVAVLVVATLAVAAILTGTTVIASRMVAPPPAQLWMLPVDGQPNEAQLGMRAGTPGGQYVIRLTSSGTQIAEYPVTLGDGEEWQTTVTFDPADRTKPIVARLYEGTRLPTSASSSSRRRRPVAVEVRRAQRIFVIGGVGSGKTTFANRLGTISGLPVHHLDELAAEPARREPCVAAILATGGWIVEGVHLGWTDDLLDAAEAARAGWITVGGGRTAR